MAAAVAILRQLNEAAEKRCILEVTDKEPISRISISAEKNWTIFFTHFFSKLPGLGSEPRYLLFSYIFSFHHFSAEPQRRPFIHTFLTSFFYPKTTDSS
jgi:hypothetical protein